MNADTAALEALRERVRDGASYQLELDIAAALNLAPEGMALHPVYALFMDAGSFDANAKTWRPPAYTASIDAAVALVGRIRPGWFWRGGHVPNVHWRDGHGYENWAHLSRTAASDCDRWDEATGWANSVPLALLDALLSSLIEAHHD